VFEKILASPETSNCMKLEIVLDTGFLNILWNVFMPVNELSYIRHRKWNVERLLKKFAWAISNILLFDKGSKHSIHDLVYIKMIKQVRFEWMTLLSSICYQWLFFTHLPSSQFWDLTLSVWKTHFKLRRRCDLHPFIQIMMCLYCNE